MNHQTAPQNQNGVDKCFAFVLSLLFLIPSLGATQIITTYAGNGNYGYAGDGGPAAAAKLAWPIGLATDNAGNVYIADVDNNVIRKVNSVGIITTLAGTGALGFTGDGGPASVAKLYHPDIITLDQAGNVYFADQNGDVIRKITTAGIITSVTGNLPLGYSGDGGPLMQARFMGISGLRFDVAGNLYISDYGNQVIRKVNTAGIISTIAGTGVRGFAGDGGPASSAKLASPYGVVFDRNGNMYIPDNGNNRIRVVNPSGIISTYAGNGTPGYSGDGGIATAAALRCPWHSTIDQAGNLYISDACNNVVRKVDPSGIITTFAGTGVQGYGGDGGPATAATMEDVCGVACDSTGNIYVVNRTQPNVVRKITNCLGAAITGQPTNVSLCSSGNAAFTVSSANATSLTWQVNTGSGWSDLSDNAFYSGSGSGSLSITGATVAMNQYNYRCTATGNCGRVYSAPATLNVVSPSSVALSIAANATTVCEGTPVTFAATATNGGSLPAFQWKKNGVNAGTNSAGYTDNSPTNGDVVSCVLSSNAFCVATPTATSNAVTITVKPKLSPTIAVTASQTNVCAGTTVAFNSTTQNSGTSPSYQWKVNGANAGTNAASFSSGALNNADKVSCVLTSNETCLATPTAASNEIVMSVTPLSTPSVHVTGSAAAICPTTVVTFTAAASNTGSQTQYVWQKNGSVVGTSTPAYTDHTLNNGDAVVCQITTTGGTCLTRDNALSNTVTTTVYPSPVVRLNKTPTICFNGTRLLDATNFSSYSWNNGSTGRTLLIRDTGIYWVQVIDKNGCMASDTTHLTTFLAQPSNFLPADTSLCSYGDLTLSPLLNFFNYAWSNGGVSKNITITQPGVYWLDATNSDGCAGRDTISVALKNCMTGFYAPSAFTPNGDRKNDEFRPLLFGNVKQYRLTVFNRWGEIVFQSTNALQGWDGKVKGYVGQTAAFVWICVYQLEGLKVETRKGTVVLIK